MNILVVDDSKVMRTIVIRTLRQAGYGDNDFAEAADGAEGLAAVKAAPPDLVLSDMNMPEMDGMGFLEALRAQGNDVKFGFVTSEGTPEIIAKATAAGAQFFITKPFTADKFKEALDEVITA